jgi:spermidine synthase
MPHFVETLYDGYGQEFRIDELLYEEKTEHQHLLIFRNARFGRVMVLDGVVQTTERDEFIYHEMLAHVPILAHGRVARVLILGGGDGGMLREVCKHRGIQTVVQVELDRKVVDLCREYLPGHSQGAFEDPRLQLVFDDGLNYVNTTAEQFDVVIVDSTDPLGPGEALFSQVFYSACKRCLLPGGILVTQNGVAFMQRDEVQTTARRMCGLFADWHFFTAAVPTYVGGCMTFGWATDDPALRQTPVTSLRKRFQAGKLATRYYNPEIHLAAFALPQYVRAAIGKEDSGHA